MRRKMQDLTPSLLRVGTISYELGTDSTALNLRFTII
ncbi:MAG: hypothetical protein ACJA09_003813 [Alcanivorax sp.]|jgi:hypothetical protein